MQSLTSNLMARYDPDDRVRLRTLILLRWMAIGGQIMALSVAHRLLGLQLELGLACLAVGATVLANFVAVFFFPESKRLSELEVMLMLLFDIMQLGFLLYLTGGIHNPFALLMLAPVTISATVLRRRMTIFLSLVAIGLITLVTFYYVPLRTAEGIALALPPLFKFGTWLAIVIGVVFMGFYAHRIASEIHSMSRALLATQMALAREQKLTDLGGVVAAAAHELGTPLATIKLVSSELMEELKDQPALREDVALIRDQADRCRDILHDMGRAGKDDRHLHQAPLESVLREAAEPHMERGKTLRFQLLAKERQPAILRRPEIIHGLRNLIQNAVDFAAQTVWIDLEWSTSQITVRIADDGPGYPPQVIGRIGEPFVRKRRSEEERTLRPEYEGMGLGLFIAKTLLERTGAKLHFANAAAPTGERCGAIVEVTWPRDRVEANPSAALGENTAITT